MKVAIELHDLESLPAGLLADLQALNVVLASDNIPLALDAIRRVAAKTAQLLCRTHDVRWQDAEPTLDRAIDALLTAMPPSDELATSLRTIQRHAGAGTPASKTEATESHVRAAAAALQTIVRWLANSPAQQTATQSVSLPHAPQAAPSTVPPVAESRSHASSQANSGVVPSTQVPSASRRPGAGRAYKVGDEPIKDYRLVRFLGRGGFGQVWKAVGPGRTEVAMKIIDLRDKNSLHEFESLRHVKGIRHTNLIDVQAIWLKSEDGQTINEQDACWHDVSQISSASDDAPAAETAGRPVELLVAMKLGDASLTQRLKEIGDTETGIPLDELLRYLEDAAKGIDFLNQRKQIIHGDIKPGNLLIVGDSAAVCDFGLAQVVENLRRTSGINCTPAYAAPESIKGKPTLKTDQYALAIAYLELRTGRLPFPKSATHMQIMEAHMNGTLDLGELAPPEREVIRRATAVNPDKRWADCGAMVQALRQAVAPPAPSKRPFWIAAAIVSLLTLLLIVWLAMPARVWLPSADFVAIEPAPWETIQGKRLSPRIARQFPDGSRVELVLVQRKGVPPFYVMETRVSNAQFGGFADATKYAWKTSSPVDDSVIDIPVEVAETFANWFGAEQLGHLPTVRQWNAAAGLSETGATDNNLLSDVRAEDTTKLVEWTRDVDWGGPRTVPVQGANDHAFVYCRGSELFRDREKGIFAVYNKLKSGDNDIGFRVVVELPID